MTATRGSGAPAGGESRDPAFAGSRTAALAGTHESTLVLAPRRRPGRP